VVVGRGSGSGFRVRVLDFGRVRIEDPGRLFGPRRYIGKDTLKPAFPRADTYRLPNPCLGSEGSQRLRNQTLNPEP
jgi:hypothetical protein